MVTAIEMQSLGDPWRVNVTLGASITDLELVIPRAAFGGPNNIAGQSTMNERSAVVILGMAINVSGAGATVVLEAQDPTFSPGGTEDFPVYTWNVAGSNTITQTIDNCCIPLAPGTFRPSPYDGATLKLTTTGTPVGHLLIWGVHTNLPFGSKFTGSPHDFSA